jgi:iron complex transport system substrate-binding protein
VPQFSRRGLLAAGGAATLGALISACGGSDDSGSAKSGGWSFTDDRGQKVTLGSPPTRIVAYIGAAAALHDFGIREQIVKSWPAPRAPTCSMSRAPARTPT